MNTLLQEFAINAACAASLRAAAAMEEATHTSRAALRPGTAAVLKISAGLDCEAVKPSGFRSDARICKFHAADHSANACVVSPRSFGCAAGFCMFQLWVLEEAAPSTLPTTHPESVAESFFARW